MIRQYNTTEFDSKLLYVYQLSMSWVNCNTNVLVTTHIKNR